MAIETTISQPFHPVTFHNAVRAGILPELVALLKTPYSTSTAGGGGPLHALRALEAIATDDPNTELDNGHALATCEAGAVPPSVKLLSSLAEPIQVAAAGLAAVLAENPQCQTMLLKAGAVPPLVRLGSFGGDGAKLRALAALDLLALNHPAALQAIANSGGRQLLEGVRRYGGETLKGLTAELLDGLDAPSKQTVTVDTAAHARQAPGAPQALKGVAVGVTASAPCNGPGPASRAGVRRASRPRRVGTLWTPREYRAVNIHTHTQHSDETIMQTTCGARRKTFIKKEEINRHEIVTLGRTPTGSPASCPRASQRRKKPQNTTTENRPLGQP